MMVLARYSVQYSLECLKPSPFDLPATQFDAPGTASSVMHPLAVSLEIALVSRRGAAAEGWVRSCVFRQA